MRTVFGRLNCAQGEWLNVALLEATPLAHSEFVRLLFAVKNGTLNQGICLFTIARSEQLKLTENKLGSSSYHRYWAKANDEHCHLLPWHSLDVAAVASVFLEQQPALSERLAKLMRLTSDESDSLIIFLLGLHDVGKFAETFQQLRPDLRKSFYPDLSIERNNYVPRHDQLGWVLWKKSLAKSFNKRYQDIDSTGVAKNAMHHWMKSVTGHHGIPPSSDVCRPHKHFAAQDIEAAHTFFDDWLALIAPPIEAIVRVYTPAPLEDEAAIPSTWPLAGFAVLCDWLGSQEEDFPFCDEAMSLADYWENQALPAARRAIARAGLIQAMSAPPKEIKSLFNYVDVPTPLQRVSVDLPLSSGPQLWILEDVTGAGKTEAALMLVHRLISQGAGNGVYIGLPTMATANAMYARMALAYRGLFDDSTKPSLILSHGARHLSIEFQSSLFDGLSTAEDYGKEETVTAQCNRWLADNRKKALLADVGVGTIDQALLAAMPAKHQSLRLFGLYGKILVLDEVHAYDFYTRELLHNLLSFHARLGGSAILLSATLTALQKSQLAGAFTGNLSMLPWDDCRCNYPLITHISDEKVTQTAVETRPSVARAVTVELLHSEASAMDNIREALAAGNCVCWVRNTVADIRDAFTLFEASDFIASDKLHVFHSRFAFGDRLEKESRMLQLFGKSSTSQERCSRLVIASQVIEQSIDLDFDLMVSDLAPIDLLIQRAGRLQRHARDSVGDIADCEGRSSPRLLVYSPELTEQPNADWYQQVFPRAHFVYKHTLLLWRTAIWLAENRGWHMPNDARVMLETIYAQDAHVPDGLEDSSLEHEGERLSQRDSGKFSSLKFVEGYVRSQTWDSEARVETRLGDESRTVYLARWQGDVLLPLIDSVPFPWDMSSVRVRATQIKHFKNDGDPALANALTKLRKEERRFDDDTVILALVERSSDTWGCTALQENDREVEIVYQRAVGLQVNPHKSGEH